MGFFDFLRKPFEEEKEAQEISLENLSSWFDSKLKKENEKVSLELEDLRNKINTETEKLRENLSKLEKAEPRNKDIPERMKQIMEGNRNTHSQKVKTLLNEINLPEDSEKIKPFADSFDTIMDRFSKDIAKSHTVMAEFFAKEAADVSRNVKSIDKFVKGAKDKIENSKIEEIRRLKISARDVQERVKRKETGEEIKTGKEKIKEKERLVKEKEDRMNKINKSGEFKEHNQLKSQKESLEKQVKELEFSLTHSFSEIDAGLKRYSNLNKDDTLAKEILDNALNAILTNKELRVAELTNKIQSYILEGSIELKDKKKSRVLNELEKLNKEYFEDFFNKHKTLNEKLANLNETLSKNTLEREISVLKKELEKAQAELDFSKSNLDKTIKELDGINPDTLKKALEGEILDDLGEEIKIN
ncbi:MAG: hypothetical protein ABIH92_00895 [Nanoarchaeota archaeon]